MSYFTLYKQFTYQTEDIHNCDFELPRMCGWQQQVFSDDTDWTRQQGSTASVNTGPYVDHTYQTPRGI